jgi:hypothetical protein
VEWSGVWMGSMDVIGNRNEKLAYQSGNAGGLRESGGGGENGENGKGRVEIYY